MTTSPRPRWPTLRWPTLGWPTLRPRLVADVLAGHSAVALALGALIYLVCLTGVLCVFIDELQLWEAPAPAPAAFDPNASDRLVGEAIRLAGGPAKAPLVFLRAPTTPRERTMVSIGPRSWTVAPSGGLVPLQLPWTGFLARLHYTLSLPAPWGEALVGLLGMGLFSLLLSGVLAHPRILRDAFVLRLGGSRRLQEADLHNRLGVWGLPFHLAVTLTGALFGLANLLFVVVASLGLHGDTAAVSRALGGPQVRADARPAALPPLARMVAQSRALTPGSQLYDFGLTAPGTAGAHVTVEVTAPGRLPRGEDATFDSRGRLLGRTRYATGDLGLQLYSGAVQVHFGVFGGLPVRLAYGVLGLALCWVCAGGTTIWLARRRDQGRPAPRLETAWSAWVWSCPLALALAALRTPLPAGPVFWLALPAAVALGQAPWAVRRRGDGAARLYRLALSAALLAVGVQRLPSCLPSATALSVDVALLAVAAALLLSSAAAPAASVRAA